MIHEGDPLFKRAAQAALRPLGFKLVRLKAYEARQGRTPPPAADSRKIFGIGFNKTATTSLEAVLREAGLRLPRQIDQERMLGEVPDTGDYGLLRAFCADYDAFQDLPFSQGETYIACDALFPGAKFVLTVRDPDRWVDSYIAFYRREFGLPEGATVDEARIRDGVRYLGAGYMHRVWSRLLVEPVAGQPVIRWDLAFDRDFLVALYEARNARIRAHFRHRPDALIEIDPAHEADTGRLLDFLGIAEMAPGPYPRANARG